MLVTLLCGLYYIVILAWTIYYLGATLLALPSGRLPWSDELADCPTMQLQLPEAIASGVWRDEATGLLNQSFAASLWCGAGAPAGYVERTVQPKRCPAQMAKIYWEELALRQSSGLDSLGGHAKGHGTREVFDGFRVT